MARPRTHLNNAPIVEALIDFRVLRREEVFPERFESVRQAVGKQYSGVSTIESFQKRFGMEQGSLVDFAPVRSPLGLLFKAQSAVAQFRVDGFTFNKLEPYTDWQDVFGEAMRLWRIYAEVAKPLEVSRLAVRYINRLRVPGPANPNEYLVSPPVLPDPIPQQIREYLSRVVISDTKRNASAILVQALEVPFDPAVIPLLLDIDAFREVSLKVDDPEIARIFQQLRELKNIIFFASVTERTVEIYE